MHSSRMRTGRSFTVCCSLLPGGGSGPGGCLVWGLSAPGGVCLVQGGSASGGCLLRGVCSGGCLLQRGVCSWGGGVFIPACTEADTPPLVDRHTLVKILSWPNFVAAGKNYFRCNIKEPLNKLNSNASKLLIVLVFISLAQPSLSFRIAS